MNGRERREAVIAIGIEAFERGDRLAQHRASAHLIATVVAREARVALVEKSASRHASTVALMILCSSDTFEGRAAPGSASCGGLASSWLQPPHGGV